MNLNLRILRKFKALFCLNAAQMIPKGTEFTVQHTKFVTKEDVWKSTTSNHSCVRLCIGLTHITGCEYLKDIKGIRYNLRGGNCIGMFCLLPKKVFFCCFFFLKGKTLVFYKRIKKKKKNSIWANSFRACWTEKQTGNRKHYLPCKMVDGIASISPLKLRPKHKICHYRNNLKYWVKYAFANSVNPGHTASDQGLHCLPYIQQYFGHINR